MSHGPRRVADPDLIFFGFPLRVGICDRHAQAKKR